MNTQRKQLFIGGALALLLSACGGGFDAPSATPPGNQVPAEASASVAGMTTWLTGLVATVADSVEPLLVNSFNPKRPDDTEPESLK